MADEIAPSWEIEDIPDEDILFMRIHRNWYVDGILNPGVFRNRPTDKDGMSTDWEKYSTALETRNRAPSPKDNAVVKMVVGKVRNIPDQTVKHTPKPDNRAHTDVFGDKKANPEARVLFSRIIEYALRLED